MLYMLRKISVHTYRVHTFQVRPLRCRTWVSRVAFSFLQGIALSGAHPSEEKANFVHNPGYRVSIGQLFSHRKSGNQGALEVHDLLREHKVMRGVSPHSSLLNGCRFSHIRTFLVGCIATPWRKTPGRPRHGDIPTCTWCVSANLGLPCRVYTNSSWK